jgi:hypothetical protein
MAKKKAAKPAASARPSPGPVLATRAHYRQAVVRLVRRQLDCARRGLIGTDHWFLAFRRDFRDIKTFAGWARFPAPCIERYDEPREIGPDGGVDHPGRNEWEISDGIPVHYFPRSEARPSTIGIEGEMQDPDVLAALNLAATHVLSEWLEWVETANEQDLETDLMPPAYFEPLVKANAENLRKWRDAGKIGGTKAGSGREVLYSVTSVLRHLRLHASMRHKLDAKWLEINLASDGEEQAGERKVPYLTPAPMRRGTESRGTSRTAYPAR